ncbi:hypothetical protein [Flindersiella endophytica]
MTDQQQMLALLQQQLTGGASMQDTIAKLAEGNPQLQQMTQLLAQREEQLQNDLDEQEQLDLQTEAEVQRDEQRRQRSEAVRRHFDDLTAELEGLRGLLDEVGAALGACPACFGTATGCRWCRGRGQPGFMPPDPAGFERLVMPAVRVHVRLRGLDSIDRTNQRTREGTRS